MSNNLPPGVTNQMIEDFANRESLLEAFERHLNKQIDGKTSDESLFLDHIYNRAPSLDEFVERAMQWAYNEGYRAGQDDEFMTGRREPS